VPAPRHVYWTNLDADTIGRANLDGTGVNQSFITGASDPAGVAVDATHVYWSNAGTDTGTIGRANLDGTGANQSFITGASGPAGVAVDAG
jgi:virginiamycin B lyase